MPRCAVHRHHRHQRQIDDDGARCPHPASRGFSRSNGRQHRPRCSHAGAPARDTFYVVEMSSFQIDLTPSLQPSIGVLLNVTPDHIDRHGTMENYAAIKERLVRGSIVACVGIDDDYSRAILKRRIEQGAACRVLGRTQACTRIQPGWRYAGLRQSRWTCGKTCKPARDWLAARRAQCAKRLGRRRGRPRMPQPLWPFQRD